MPRLTYKEDLFKDSTMTFGEHLEELRKCLWKAVLGLLIALVAGFYFGGDVVDLIQVPLQRALKAHYQGSSQKKIEEEIQRLAGLHEKAPVTAGEAKALIMERGLLPEIVYIRAEDLARQLKTAYPDQFKDLPLGKGSEPSSSASPVSGEGAPADATNTSETSATPNPEAKADARESAPTDMMELLLWHRVDDDKRLRATALNVHEGFMIWLKASLLVGVVFSSPWIFYQIWSFIAAGLYPHERHYVNMYLPMSVALFILGVLVAFFGAFPLILKFLFQFNRSMGIEIDPRISEWLSFVMMLPLGFGISFQLPLVMLFLERIRICTVSIYWSYWRVAVVIIFAIAAIFTPPDPWSMAMLAAPLTLLYFVGILLCKWLPRGPSLLDLPEPEAS
jgi:sec-independent protein translocase protein TatC